MNDTRQVASSEESFDRTAEPHRRQERLRCIKRNQARIPIRKFFTNSADAKLDGYTLQQCPRAIVGGETSICQNKQVTQAHNVQA